MMIKQSMTRRLDGLERQSQERNTIPVLFVEQFMEHVQTGTSRCITLSDYEAGRLPRGCGKNTVVIIDDLH